MALLADHIAKIKNDQQGVYDSPPWKISKKSECTHVAKHALLHPLYISTALPTPQVRAMAWVASPQDCVLVVWVGVLKLHLSILRVSAVLSSDVDAGDDEAGFPGPEPVP